MIHSFWYVLLANAFLQGSGITFGSINGDASQLTSSSLTPLDHGRLEPIDQLTSVPNSHSFVLGQSSQTLIKTPDRTTVDLSASEEGSFAASGKSKEKVLAGEKAAGEKEEQVAAAERREEEQKQICEQEEHNREEEKELIFQALCFDGFEQANLTEWARCNREYVMNLAHLLSIHETYIGQVYPVRIVMHVFDLCRV